MSHKKNLIIVGLAMLLIMTGCESKGIIDISDCKQTIITNNWAPDTWFKDYVCSENEYTKICSARNNAWFSDKCEKAYTYSTILKPYPTLDKIPNAVPANSQLLGILFIGGLIWLSIRAAKKKSSKESKKSYKNIEKTYKKALYILGGAAIIAIIAAVIIVIIPNNKTCLQKINNLSGSEKDALFNYYNDLVSDKKTFKNDFMNKQDFSKELWKTDWPKYQNIISDLSDQEIKFCNL